MGREAAVGRWDKLSGPDTRICLSNPSTPMKDYLQVAGFFFFFAKKRMIHCLFSLTLTLFKVVLYSITMEKKCEQDQTWSTKAKQLLRESGCLLRGFIPLLCICFWTQQWLWKIPQWDQFPHTTSHTHIGAMGTNTDVKRFIFSGSPFLALKQVTTGPVSQDFFHRLS